MPTFEAKEVEPSKIVCLAEGVLPGGLVRNGEELGCNNFAAVLDAGQQDDQ